MREASKTSLTRFLAPQLPKMEKKTVVKMK
jgi:hypothetical protein